MANQEPQVSLSRRAAAELLGTALLLATVVGSGIMGERIAGGNVAIALLANTIATGAGLVALITTFGPVSGAHFNPAVQSRMRVRVASAGATCRSTHLLQHGDAQQLSPPGFRPSIVADAT